MTAIWFILAGMTAAAVLGLLWPLSRRAAVPTGEAGTTALATETAFYEDQIAEIARDLERGLIAPEEAEAARAEAGRRLLRASRDVQLEAKDAGAAEAARPAEPRLRRRRAASAFAVSTIPLVALIAYGLYGSPELPAQTDADRQAARGGADELMKAVGQIEARLARDPNDARGWAVLAPVYMRTGRFDDAARAYGNIARLKGETADLLADQGEALTAAADGTVTPDAKALFEKAQAKEPNAPKPRFYLARAAEQAGDTGEAIRQLTTLEAASPPDAPWLGVVRQTLARLKGEPAPLAPAPTEPKIPAAQQAAIRGMVDGLDARLKAGGGTPDEWLRLVRSRTVLGEHDQAAAALARARTALAGDPQGLAQVEQGARAVGLDAEGGPVRPAEPTPAGPAARAETEAAMAAVRAMPQAERDAAIRGMVDGLDRRLAARGGTPDEWMRLVRSYSALGERDQAIKALDRARMALAANGEAVVRLDGLARELDLPAKTNP
ncbi:cytochrome c-type biogenesis protein CcmH [Methylobacterium phyllostachyos]|uniref:Cytochrome c-type biogenesis protein CcmH n=1 Tax=Methylobacterium phyllostachyos TaxID=582672 RepID=A0A1H0CHI4_9HYPH|nr:c-type cytochrome biogenesis protein CcmI [Methylobacterium phyllostachyos]SDN57319.1 cytochrome c-type biogenesis protein CcmH [Methylobacterium phyllostachyos]